MRSAAVGGVGRLFQGGKRVERKETIYEKYQKEAIW